jgi:hypothetical protein
MRSDKSWRCLLAGVFAVGLLLGASGTAQAQVGSFWRPQGTKSGPIMLNLKMGGAFGAYYYGPYLGHYFVLQTEVGFAVTRDRNGYLILPLTFELAPGAATIMIPFGFQYDIPLPVPGLYLTPRISAGFAATVLDRYYAYYGYYGATSLSGVFIPEFGIKYILKGRLNFGAEPFSLPILFNGNGVSLQYRVLIYGGINF